MRERSRDDRRDRAAPSHRSPAALDLFEELVEATDREKEERLRSLASSDPALRAEVKALLSADSELGDWYPATGFQPARFQPKDLFGIIPPLTTPFTAPG